MSIYEEIEKLLGRKVDFQKTDKGFLPVYINYNFQAKLADMFSEDKDECAQKFLSYLESIQGDTDANNENDSTDDRGVSTNN